jgi:hypothetical protein
MRRRNRDEAQQRRGDRDGSDIGGTSGFHGASINHEFALARVHSRKKLRPVGAPAR